MKLIHQLDNVLTLLLPIPGNINSLVTKIIEEAITLANDLTREKAIYKSYIADGGSQPEPLKMDYFSDGQSGNVFLCTYPGFFKLVHNGNKVTAQPLVKASVELESVVNSN